MGRDRSKNRLICAEYWPFFSECYTYFCIVRVENKLAGGDVVFVPRPFLLCCVVYVEWDGVGGWWCWAEFCFFFATPHFFYRQNIYAQFFTKPNLFLSRFVCNFTPILFFFCLEFFFVGGVFVVHSCYEIFRIISTNNITRRRFFSRFILGRFFVIISPEGTPGIQRTVVRREVVFYHATRRVGNEFR